MMIDFRTLQQVATPTLCDAFNTAFSDYIVPLHLTPSIMEQKIQGENLHRDYSIGAFAGNELRGFILHAPDDHLHPTMLYNGGTGVIPAYRGQRLVQQMYDHFIPRYHQQGIQKIILEVISSNIPAIKAYSSTGFEKIRTINAYKGNIRIDKTPAGISVKENKTPDWSVLATFMDMEPTWSNSVSTLLREAPFTTTWEAAINGETVGYISVHRDTRRIRNIAVHSRFRRQGVGSTLLRYAATHLDGPFTIINIDENFREIGLFLERAGLEQYLSQYEMVLKLKS